MNKYLDVILETSVHSIVSRNSRIIVCGRNLIAMQLVKELVALQLSGHIAGIIDPINPSTEISVAGFSFFQLDNLSTVQYDEVIVTYDQEKESILEILKQHIPSAKRIRVFGNSNYDFADPIFNDIIASLHVKSLAAGYPDMLHHLYQSIRYIEASGIKGDIVEFGTFRGGTTVFFAKLLEKLGSGRKVISFDTFAGFPAEASALDMFSEGKYGKTDYQTVSRYCEGHNIELVQGDIKEKVETLGNGPIALSFFDTDNYTATKIALAKVLNLTPSGGILAFDHFFSKDWLGTLGERMAAKEILNHTNSFNLHGTGIFIKI